MSSGEKSIWDFAIDHAKASEDGDNTGDEGSLLVMGSKASGKTSLILRFLERDEPPKPTTALEYTFGRRAKGHNLAKDVGHVWELGGGTWLSRLTDIPVTPDTIEHLAIAIILDLSKPNEMWATLEKLLATCKTRMEAVINEARVEKPNIKEKLKAAAKERIGGEHTDMDLLDLFLVPLVIIGGKYDLFQEFDPEKRKVLCKTLRFVAHVHGAHLQFLSTKQEVLMTKGRNIISHLVFNTNVGKLIQLDYNSPLTVPYGQDSMQLIGNPPLPDGDIGKITARTPMDLWKQAFGSYFPQENISEPSSVEDPAKDPQYREPAVDAMRVQKDEELERYRRLSERRVREAQKRPLGQGVVG